MYAQCKKGDGTLSPVHSDSIILDTVPPKGTIQINSGLYSTNTRTVALTLTASDLNGVKEMQFSLNSTTWTSWEAFSGNKTITLPIGQGVKTVWVKYKDNAGKVSAGVSDTIVIDSVSPIGTVAINSGATVITNRTVTLSFTAGGATYLKLSLDGGATWAAWEPYVTSKKATFPEGDGTKTVQVYFRDLTGNISTSPASDSASYILARPPAGITVPDSDPDNSYAVAWSVSPTPGVTYELQEATNSGFTTGIRTAYSGLTTSITITSRTRGLSYYYRVRAKKAGYESSSWTTGANGCNVGSPAVPASITVPLTDADGNYAISWGASTTPGITYVVEEATDTSFTLNLKEVFAGTARTRSITSNTGGGTKYYYRVKARKTGFPDSIWRAGANGCKVGTAVL